MTQFNNFSFMKQSLHFVAATDLDSSSKCCTGYNRALSLHTLDNVVDALDGGDGVDETGVDIIDALDIFLVGAGTHESKDFTEKEIRTWEGARSGSPAAGILAARGSVYLPCSMV
jgi:hypothetical protein